MAAVEDNCSGVDQSIALARNEARMRAFRAFWVAVFALGGTLQGAPVCAQSRDVGLLPRAVLIQPEGEPIRPDLEPSLRIQLRSSAELSALSRRLPADLPSRLALAGEVADAEQADWLLWIEPAEAERSAGEPSAASEQVVLYLVGRREGRALVEVVRVPASEGPEADRSLALKVGELIDAHGSAKPALGNKVVASPAPALAEAPPSPVTPAADEPRPRVQLWLEAGGQLALGGDAGAALDVLVALGPSVAVSTLLIALPVELTVGLPRRVEQSGDEAEWSELGVALWAKLATRLDRLLLGGGLGAKLVFTDVEGTAASGKRGDAHDLLPALLASADGELLFTESFGARLALGAELRSKRRHFVLEGENIGNTGRVVPFARLSLIWHAL